MIPALCKSALGRFFVSLLWWATRSDVHWHYFCPVPADRGAGIQQQPLKDAYGAKDPRLSDGMQCTVGQIRLETRRRSYGIGLRFSCCKSVNCSILTSIRLGVWAVA